MSADPPVIEYFHFMNWLQNNRPGLYTEYWKIIEPSEDESSLQVKLPVMNDAILKKLEQVTGEYLAHLRSN